MEEKNAQKRLPAVVVSIGSLLSGTFVEQVGWEPNFVKLADGSMVSRVNLIGVIVDLPQPVKPFEKIDRFSCVVDDGTDKITVRTFDSLTVADELVVGTPVMIIGRPRKYNDMLFIVAEIIRKISNTGWIEVRKKQIEKQVVIPIPVVVEKPAIVQSEIDKETTVLDIIDSMDTGDGVLVEDAVKKIQEKRPGDAKNRITQLLLSGDIFEIRPGRIKVLK